MELVKASETIGNIASSNCHYTAGLTAKLATLNKPLLLITIGELIAVHQEYSIFFNQIMEV